MNRMTFRLFQKRNSSEKNTNTVYSEYSYSGIRSQKNAPLVKDYRSPTVVLNYRSYRLFLMVQKGGGGGGALSVYLHAWRKFLKLARLKIGLESSQDFDLQLKLQYIKTTSIPISNLKLNSGRERCIHSQ